MRAYFSCVILLTIAVASSASYPYQIPVNKARIFHNSSPEDSQTATDLGLLYLQSLLPNYGIEKLGDLQVLLVDIDELSMAHVRVQQTMDGVQVIGAQAIVHLRSDGTVSSFTDGLLRNISVSTAPTVTKEVAIREAIRKYGCETCLTAQAKADLAILRRENRDFLVWRIQLSRQDGTNREALPLYFINAHTGKTVWSYDNLQTIAPTKAATRLRLLDDPFQQFGTATSGETLYRGLITMGTGPPDPMFGYCLVYLTDGGAENRTYYLEDIHRNIGTFNGDRTTRFVDTDQDNVFGNTVGTQYQKAGVDVHWGTEKTLDYYRFFHGRTSIDGFGGPKTFLCVDGRTHLFGSMVHYGNNVNNASWVIDHVDYGDGDNENFSPLVSIDVIGHEITHGVTQYSAGLAYYGESGALNESVSDVFGSLVEYFVTGGSASNSNIWRIGEQCFTPAVPGDAFRYMDDPHQAANLGLTANDDPDHYSERYLGELDNGGIHHNSGIPNKVFYLVSQGGMHHLGGSVTGIGPYDAGRIWYRALTRYMVPSTDFAAARVATLIAAEDLFGSNSRQYESVAQAWTVCGITSSCVSSISASQSFAANGGTGNVNITSGAGCNWTATTSDSWIEIDTGNTGSGNGVVTYTVAANPGPNARNGTISVAGRDVAIAQGIPFNDVSVSHPFYNEIGKLSARAVTLGCGNGDFCPNDPVTREQMAAFIMRAKGEFNPPTPPSQRFGDVPPTNQFYNFIDRLAELEITLGCQFGNPPVYCPSDPVKREQISAFLLRALGEMNPTTPASQKFGDVPPSNQFYNFIDRLAVLQITQGCQPGNPPLFCPNDSVTRAQMAAFLVRAFNL